LSVAQLERRFRRVFQPTPQEVLTKLRIEAAMRLPQGNQNRCIDWLGPLFVDQSAFARQFKTTVGVTPRDYRAMVLVQAAKRVDAAACAKD
jgi:AraC-like DNA-binding protein